MVISFHNDGRTHSVLMRGMSGSGVTGRRWFTGLCVSWMNSRLSVFEKNLHIQVRFTIWPISSEPWHFRLVRAYHYLAVFFVPFHFQHLILFFQSFSAHGKIVFVDAMKA